jgi:hypothetical protein
MKPRGASGGGTGALDGIGVDTGRFVIYPESISKRRQCPTNYMPTL